MAQRFQILLIFAALMVRPAAAQVPLKTRTVNRPSGRSAVQLLRKSAGRSHILVEMKVKPDAQAIRMWRLRGIRVVGQAPPRGLMLSVPDGVDPGEANVRWAVRLNAEDKVSALVGSDEEAPGAYVVEFYPDVDMALGRELVVEMGMQMQAHPDLVSNQLLVSGSAGAIAGLAAWDEVAYVFPASVDLLAGNHVLACAGALGDAGLVGQYVKVSQGWSGGPQGVVLSYMFSALTSKLPASTVQSEVVRALNEWARYAPLAFQPGSSATAPRTIAIQFVSGQHGDGYNFDGPGGTLAHSFYPAPPNMESIAGDMHFDADENWGNPQQLDLYSVALHEAGHALGLGHSDKAGSVMYPYYRLNAQLSNDDIAGIRAIYSASTATPQPPLSITVTSPNAAAVAVTTSSIAVSGTVAGISGSAQVSWMSNQGPSGKATGSSIWSIPVVPLNTGTNIITVTASDTAGNIASRVVTVTRQPATANPTTPPTPQPTAPATPTTPPTSPPSLKIASPGFSIVSTSAATITFSGTASADTTAVAWTNSTGFSGTATGTVAWTANIALMPGTNTITVKAYNLWGSSWRSVTVVRR